MNTPNTCFVCSHEIHPKSLRKTVIFDSGATIYPVCDSCYNRIKSKELHGKIVIYEIDENKDYHVISHNQLTLTDVP